MGACRVRDAARVDRIAAHARGRARCGCAHRGGGEATGRADRRAGTARRRGPDARGGAGRADRRVDRPRRRVSRRGAWMASVAGTRAISDVEGLVEIRGPIDLTARFMAALEPIEADLFDQARAAGRREPPDALAFDAIIQMADESAEVATKASGNRVPATVIVRVDHAALGARHHGAGRDLRDRRDRTRPRAGRPQARGRRLHPQSPRPRHDRRARHQPGGRTIPARLRTALEELFPECCIEGCHTDRHLEIDHNIPIAEGGPTALWNLTRPCHHHHDHKHTHNLRIVGQGTRRHLEPAPRTADRAPPVSHPNPMRKSHAGPRVVSPP